MRTAMFLPRFNLIVDIFNSFESNWASNGIHVLILSQNAFIGQIVAINSKHITITFHVLIWSAVLLLPYFFSAPESHFGKVGPLQCNFFTITNIMHIGLFYFNAYFLYARFLSYRRWWIYILSLVVLVAGLYNVKAFILNTWFPLLATDEDAFRFTFFPILFFLVISTIFRLVTDKINLEKEQLTMELRFLRSQVNPHFLFNILNNLVSMARHRSDQLEHSLMKLSGLMRYMLHESDERRISLADEFEYLRNYISLQELRFDGDVMIQSNIPFEENSYSIEPMLLIPFVENAFKHGIVEEKPFIRVDASVKDHMLYFKVTNRFENGNQSKDNTSGIGLGNVKARLRLLYPKRHKLLIEKKDGIFEVDLQIKLN